MMFMQPNEQFEFFIELFDSLTLQAANHEYDSESASLLTSGLLCLLIDKTSLLFFVIFLSDFQFESENLIR